MPVTAENILYSDYRGLAAHLTATGDAASTATPQGKAPAAGKRKFKNKIEHRP